MLQFNGIVLAGFATLIMLAGFQQYRIQMLKHDYEEASLALQSCDARIANITEDMRSDGEIDALSDDELRAAAERWMQTLPTSGD